MCQGIEAVDGRARSRLSKRRVARLASCVLSVAAALGPSLPAAWSQPDLVWSADLAVDSQHLAWADVDCDGNLDLATMGSGRLDLHRGRGGQLELAVSLVEGLETELNAVAWGDVDGDRRPDLVLAGGTSVRLFRNESRPPNGDDDGALQLAEWTVAWDGGATAVALADLDGDGDLDLVVGGAGLRVLRNTGDETLPFASWWSDEGDDVRDVAAGNLDDDLDLELVAGTWGAPDRVYDAGEDGTYSIDWSSSGSTDTVGVRLGDLDRDGDLDIYAAQVGAADEIYRNDYAGDAAFETVPSGDAVVDSGRPALGDWDLDGDLDVAVPHPDEAVILGNQGPDADDWFVPSWNVTAVATRAAAFGDLDGDGQVELALAAEAEDLVYRSDVFTFRRDTTWDEEVLRALAGDWGDLDGDGRPDLAVAVFEGPNRIYAYNGTTMTLAWSAADDEDTRDDLDGSRDLAWGDFDGDGDPDLAVANDAANRVYENLGGGELALVWSGPDADSVSRGVAWGDLDNDGDLDLAFGNVGANRVYANSGGGFAVAWTAADDENTEDDDDISREVAWADYDGDGFLDLAVANNGENRVYRNDGVGGLELVWSSDESENSLPVAWADYDADGDLDLTFGNESVPDRIYENDEGSLSTTASWSSAATDRTRGLSWGDYDGDGDLDLATAAAGGTYSRVYRNGEGGLAPVWQLLSTWDNRELAWGDVDGDGDLDLGMVSFNRQPRLYLNERFGAARRSNNPTHLRLGSPAARAAEAGQVSVGQVLWPSVPLDLTLFDAESDPVAHIDVQFSLDGGGTWQDATIMGQRTGLLTDPAGRAFAGSEYPPVWLAEADGAVGHDVVLRAVVTHQYPVRVAAPVQHGRVAALSPPFRLCRGDGDRDGRCDRFDLDDDGDGDPDATDCAPLDATVHGGAVEICDGLDNNCAGGVDEGDVCVVADRDNDGDPDATDCAPDDATRRHGVAEICDGLDNNCTGGVDEGFGDGATDGDGDSYTPCTGDCDDRAASVFPGAEEACDETDSDCDGDLVDDFDDGDGDGRPDCVDEDRDGDLVVDGLDNCPGVANGDQTDLDGDGAGDACDPDPGDPVADAGPHPSDAGGDGGSARPDSGSAPDGDASAGTDAGDVQVDADLVGDRGPDAGGAEPAEDSAGSARDDTDTGCGCAVSEPGAGGGGGAGFRFLPRLWLLALVGVTVWRRRRRGG